MALFDAMFEFDDAHDVFSTNNTVVSSNVLDMQASDLEMGAGTPLYLNCRVSTAFAGGTSVQVILRADTDANKTGGTDIYLSEALSTPTNAETAAGAWLCRIPLDVDFDKDQYIYVAYTCVGAVSAGAVNTWIDHGPQSSHDTQVYNSNIT